jgi:hypothetical protein
MHSPFLLSGGPQIHTAEPLLLHFILSARGGRQYARYPITTNGVKKAITPDRFDDRDDKTLTQDRVPLEA